MKFILASLIALATFVSQAATKTDSYYQAGNTTNTLFTNSVIISGVSFINTNLTTPSVIRFYDSTGAVTTVAFTSPITNVTASLQSVTEYFTNAVFSFKTSFGHMTNFVRYTTNVTTVLKTTQSVTPASTNELNRIMSFTLAPNSTTTFTGLGINVNQGLTFATLTSGAGVFATFTYTE